MSHNPYAPPSASVADPVPQAIERPREVLIAVRLLWATLALAAVGIFFTPSQAALAGLWTYVVIALAVVGVLWAWVIYKIYQGANWARVLFVVLVGLGILFLLISWRTYVATFRASPMAAADSITQTVLEIIAAVMLFSQNSNAWFARIKALKAGG